MEYRRPRRETEIQTVEQEVGITQKQGDNKKTPHSHEHGMAKRTRHLYTNNTCCLYSPSLSTSQLTRGRWRQTDLQDTHMNGGSPLALHEAQHSPSSSCLSRGRRKQPTNQSPQTCFHISIRGNFSSSGLMARLCPRMSQGPLAATAR